MIYRKYMKLKIFLLLYLISVPSFASEIGKYGIFGGNYKYYGLNQAIQNQRINAQIRQRQYNYYNNPARNIKYPTNYNPYPNIQRTNYPNLTARQRYSPLYYEQTYR